MKAPFCTKDSECVRHAGSTLRPALGSHLKSRHQNFEPENCGLGTRCALVLRSVDESEKLRVMNERFRELLGTFRLNCFRGFFFLQGKNITSKSIAPFFLVIIVQGGEKKMP